MGINEDKNSSHGKTCMWLIVNWQVDWWKLVSIRRINSGYFLVWTYWMRTFMLRHELSLDSSVITNICFICYHCLESTPRLPEPAACTPLEIYQQVLIVLLSYSISNGWGQAAGFKYKIQGGLQTWVRRICVSIIRQSDGICCFKNWVLMYSGVVYRLSLKIAIVNFSASVIAEISD